MDESKRVSLIARRERAKILSEITSYCSQHVLPWMEVYRELTGTFVPFDIVYFAATLNSDNDLIREALLTVLPDHEHHMLSHLIESPELPVHRMMEECFPSRQNLRYFPSGDSSVYGTNQENLVSRAFLDLNIADAEHCLICYPLFTPVISIAAGAIKQHATTLFDQPESVAVLDKDFNWIIFKSLEDEWTWFTGKNR